jgi:hypothetical protein
VATRPHEKRAEYRAAEAPGHHQALGMFCRKMAEVRSRPFGYVPAAEADAHRQPHGKL